MNADYPPNHPQHRRRRARAIAITHEQARAAQDGPSLAFATAGFLGSMIATIGVALALAAL